MLFMCISTAPSLTHEFGGYGCVGPALGHQHEDIPLARSQCGQGMAAAGEQLGDGLGIEGAALSGPAAVSCA